MVDQVIRIRTVIIGAGFGGIGLGVRLQEQGDREFLLLEKADKIGGVWRENTYPGAACDVPSHLYSFSFFPRADWSRRFAPQAEILDYMHRTVEHFGLDQHIQLDTRVEEARFNEQLGRWEIEAERKVQGKMIRQRIVAKFLVAACGQLSRPAVPRIPGAATFRGRQFHSAQWDHETSMTGKRVVVIGTGASAIQFVPEIAREAASLTVMQRSAPYVIHKPDRLYRNWEQRLLEAFPWLLKLSRAAVYAHFEARFVGFKGPSRLMNLMVGQWRRRMESVIADPELRAKLTPDYPFGSKRILQSNDYYPTFNRPNVSLETEPLACFTGDGIKTETGRVIPADVVIYGTGFRSTEFLTPMKVFGRDGIELNESWSDGAEAYLGTTVAGCPNFFMLYGPNTNLGHNSILYMLESQFSYILSCFNYLERHGLDQIEVLAEVQNRFNEEIQRKASETVWNSDCNSWYKTADGKITNNWPDFTWKYRQLTRTLNPADYRMSRRPLADNQTALQISPREEAVA